MGIGDMKKVRNHWLLSSITKTDGPQWCYDKRPMVLVYSCLQCMTDNDWTLGVTQYMTRGYPAYLINDYSDYIVSRFVLAFVGLYLYDYLWFILPIFANSDIECIPHIYEIGKTWGIRNLPFWFCGDKHAFIFFSLCFLKLLCFVLIIENYIRVYLCFSYLTVLSSILVLYKKISTHILMLLCKCSLWIWEYIWIVYSQEPLQKSKN